MANTIILKKSSTASAAPGAGSLQPGELAVNLADKKLYSKTTGGTVILVGSGNPEASTITGTVSVANGGTGASSLTSGYLLKGNGTSAVTSSVVYDNGTNVGIGVTNPAEKLQVDGGVLARYQHLYESMLIGSGQNNVNYIEIGAGRTGENTSYIDLITDNTTYTDYGTRLVRLAGVNAETSLYHRGTGQLSFVTSDAAPIGFYTSGTAKMSITASGNVGINTTDPTTLLQIGNIGATDATYQGRIKLEDSSSSLESAGGLEFVTSAFGSGYGWKINSIDTAGSGVHLLFGSRQNSTTWSEVMRIDEVGNVGIGSSDPTYKLDVVSGGTDVAEFVSNDAGSAAGPVVYYYRNSASPANADTGPRLNMNGNSSTGVQRTYAAIITDFDTVTNAAEVGSLRFAVSRAGSLTSVLDINGPAGTIQLTGTTGLQIERTAVTAPAAGDGNVFSGTYTPSLSNTTNIASSTATVCHYMRVGDVVTVGGQVTIDPTATGRIVMGMTLPIASNFGNARQVGGTFAAAGSTSVNVGSISADTTNDRATFDGVVADTNSRSYYFTFTYLVV